MADDNKEYTKHVVGVSIGSKKRDHRVIVELLGEKVLIERIGTDGSMDKAVEMIQELDGKADAIGLGGIDLYLTHKNRRWVIRDAVRLVQAAKITPVLDGSGMKNTLESQVVEFVATQTDLLRKGKKALVISSVDRPGMAEAVWKSGAKTIYGDFIFGLKLPIPLHSYRTVDILAPLLLPIITRMPFEKLYPTGKTQEIREPNKFRKYFEWADLIAGDFNLIRRYLPDSLPGRTVITNTTTSSDVALMKQVGIKYLITTTPELDGRTFGTNVIEALVVALMGKKPEQITTQDNVEMLKKLNFEPKVVEL